MLKKDEKGFSAVEIIVIIVIVALLGAVGWLVYDRNHHKTTPLATTTTPAKTTPVTQVDSFVNVIQDDDRILQMKPDEIAKTSDEAAILTALHDTCKGNYTYVTVNHVVFDGKPNFIQDGKYAEINATACTNVAKTLSDLNGSGAANYLHKNSSGTWILDTASQMGPDCKKVDGLGYPTTIIITCNDGSTTRAPK